MGAGRLQTQRRDYALRSAMGNRTDAERQQLVSGEINASGREQDIQTLVRRVKEQRHRLTIIYGASGVGKSSLLRAALLPTLRQDSGRTIIPVLQTVYTDWQASLASCFVEAFNWLGFNSQHLLNAQSALAQEPSLEAVIAQLRLHANSNILTVLIFDQFEEFLLAHPEMGDRLPFYAFLKVILNIPSVKVILAMRSDYLHYLLECNDRELVGLDVVNHDILSTDILYYLGKFSPQQARDVIERLTGQARSGFAPDLVAALLTDLQGSGGKIRPIELQIVGAQLQSERVATLSEYQANWDTKKLVEKYLTDIVADCGPENEALAWNILDLLIDPKREVRPIRSRSELEQLGADKPQLDLVLTILHGSRLIFRHQLSVEDEEQFQLVHDYFVLFIQGRKEKELALEIKGLRDYKYSNEAMEYLVNSVSSVRSSIKKSKLRNPFFWFLIFFISLSTSVLRIFGFFQGLELISFDFFSISSLPETVDQDILIIEVGEDDVVQGTDEISSSLLNSILKRILASQPEVIGLNIFIDQKDGKKILEETIQENNKIVVSYNYFGNRKDRPKNTKEDQTKNINEDQMGANNLLIDSDGYVRRNLLYFRASSQQDHIKSFPLAILEKYVGSDRRMLTKYETLIGKENRISTYNYGMYSYLDSSGYQLIANFKDPQDIEIVSATDFLRGKVESELIQDRVVFVGYALETDLQFKIPYSRKYSGERVTGTEIFANFTSQLISAVSEDRSPSIHALSFWTETIITLAVSIFISLSAWLLLPRDNMYISIAYVFFVLTIWGIICYLLFIYSLLLPLFPTAFSAIITASLVLNMGKVEDKKHELIKTVETIALLAGDNKDVLRFALEYLSAQQPKYVSQIEQLRVKYESEDNNQ